MLSEGKGLQVLGLKPSEVVGQSAFGVYSDVPEIVRNIRRALKGDEFTAVVPVGELFFETWYSPMRDQNGEVSGVIGVAIDITERKRTEEELRLLSSVAEQSTEGMAVVDLEGNLLFVNNAFAAMHGYTADELAGKHLSVFHTPEQIPSVEAANRQIQQTGEFSGEIWHVRRDGTTFPTLMYNSLLRDEKGNPIGMIGTVRDITERKKMEEQLMVTDRLASIGELASGIAHELNNPLTSVIGFSDLLIGKKDLPDDIKEDLKIINRESTTH